MLRNYEAICTGNQFRWIGQAPPNQEMRVMVVANVVESKVKADDEIDEILDRTWGCFNAIKLSLGEPVGKPRKSLKTRGFVGAIPCGCP